MSFNYLWKHREKSPVFSWRWLKQWIKRILNIDKLIKIVATKTFLKRAGVQIGDISVVSAPNQIEGSLARLIIGDFSFIGQVHIAVHADVKIGSYVTINDGVKLLTASHRTDDPLWSSFAEPIIIDDYAWIATDAIILPGVCIGKGAVVGAGAVVAKDIPPYGIVVGNPARLIDKNRTKNLTYNPVQLISCYEAWLGKVMCSAKESHVN
jgi:acetyltransferase-like isoleucine patch superfamily enzyme